MGRALPHDRAAFDTGLDSLLALGYGLVEIAGVGEAAYGDEASIRAFQAPCFVEVQVQGLVQLDGTKTITDLTLTALAANFTVALLLGS
ncbi:MAG TPA: hypothetical protein VFY84_10030 [Jiangellales bacterium]|nr:hypothetical protein [Jiangellales bacterium]